MTQNAHSIAVGDKGANAEPRSPYEIVARKHSVSNISLLSWVKARVVGPAVPASMARVGLTKQVFERTPLRQVLFRIFIFQLSQIEQLPADCGKERCPGKPNHGEVGFGIVERK